MMTVTSVRRFVRSNLPGLAAAVPLAVAVGEAVGQAAVLAIPKLASLVLRIQAEQ
jgi:hypothetical protein